MSKILIGNIPSDTTEEILRQLLAERIGGVVNLTIPQNSKTGKHQGYVIVELPTDIAATEAVNVLKGCVLDGRVLSTSIEASAVKQKRKWYEFGKR